MSIHQDEVWDFLCSISILYSIHCPLPFVNAGTRDTTNPPGFSSNLVGTSTNNNYTVQRKFLKVVKWSIFGGSFMNVLKILIGLKYMR